MKRFLFILSVILSVTLVFSFSSCVRVEEMTAEEIYALQIAGLEDLLARTIVSPRQVLGEVSPGRLGGTWNRSMLRDPRTFNHLIAERDQESNDIIRMMNDWLVEYDRVLREWRPRIAYFEIVIDEENQTLDVIYTLREGLYWSYYNSDVRIPVTSDDVIFWYDEIEGDPEFRSSALTGQFLVMPDGSDARVTIHRIDDRSFRFHFPRIVADPLLHTNMDFGPRHAFEPALREGGHQGVMDLFNIASDPRLIPSMGRWFLVQYVPMQRLVFRRNPNFWQQDSAGLSIPFPEEYVIRILPNQTTELLEFRSGNLDWYRVRPEDLVDMVNNQEAEGFSIFSAEGSIGAPLWSFNQNPLNNHTPQYDWFTRKEFRQAMSSMLNRDRINSQAFRGLAEPKLDFFPPPNPFFNPDIVLQFQFNPERALELLASIGITQDSRGIMRDSQNRRVEFSLTFPADNAVHSSVASIIADELRRIGIRVNLRATDFQRIVEQLTVTYDWQTVIIGLGNQFFPTQGTNVWPSSGNLHLWHPLQESPATYWEARIDYLFNEGKFTRDTERAWEIWNEFQEIILYQMPIIYLMRPRGFRAVQNDWDFSNIFFDNTGEIELQHVFLRQ